MNPKDSRIIDLMVKYARREKLTVEEMQLLEDFWKQSPGHRRLAELFGDEEWVKAELSKMEPAPIDEMWEEIDKYLDAIGAPKDSERPPIVLVEEGDTDGEIAGPSTMYQRRPWVRPVGIAATVAFCVMGAGLLYNQYFSATTKPYLIAAAAEPPILVPDDNGILLQAADGSTINIDAVPIGTVVARVDSEFVLKVDTDQLGICRLEDYPDVKGMPVLAVSPDGPLVRQTVYVGSHRTAYLLRMADGGTVWLHGGAYLRYPVGRRGKTDRYDMGGLAYFDVKKDPFRPLEIRTPDGSKIDVLGTVFNVDCRKQTAGNLVTLLSGSLAVQNGTTRKQMKPDEEATLGPGKIDIRPAADPGTVTAWLGEPAPFHFDGTAFDSAVARVASWYRCTISNVKGIRGPAIDATVRKEHTPEGVLKAIQDAASDRVYLWLEGKVIVISDKPKGT